MVFHAAPRKLALRVEATFVTDESADWSLEIYFFATQVDTSGVIQQIVPNENNVLRPRFKHDNIHTLRNATMPLGVYLHGNPTQAAEAAQAEIFHLAVLARSALGGQRLGWSIGVQTSGGEAANELEVDANPGFEIGDWIAVVDTTANRVYWHQVLAIDVGPPVTLTLDRDKAFTPAEDDVVRAVIDVYVSDNVTTDHASSDHTTLQFLVEGAHPEDVVICRGCKPSLSLEPIAPGQPMQMTFDVAVTDFDGPDEAVQADFAAATPVGEAGLVPGVGTTNEVFLADQGSPLSSILCRGEISIAPGPTYQPVTGPCGPEGVNGYVDDISQDTTLTLMVEFDAAYNAEFRAHQHKHCLVAVGEDPSDAVAFYFPELEYAAEPPRNDQGNLTGTTLSFRGHLNTADPGALAGDALEKWLSPFHILMIA